MTASVQQNQCLRRRHRRRRRRPMSVWLKRAKHRRRLHHRRNFSLAHPHRPGAATTALSCSVTLIHPRRMDQRSVVALNCRVFASSCTHASTNDGTQARTHTNARARALEICMEHSPTHPRAQTAQVHARTSKRTCLMCTCTPVRTHAPAHLCVCTHTHGADLDQRRPCRRVSAPGAFKFR